jgi:hypothetical protein
MFGAAILRHVLSGTWGYALALGKDKARETILLLVKHTQRDVSK